MCDDLAPGLSTHCLNTLAGALPASAGRFVQFGIATPCYRFEALPGDPFHCGNERPHRADIVRGLVRRERLEKEFSVDFPLEGEEYALDEICVRRDALSYDEKSGVHHV